VPWIRSEADLGEHPKLANLARSLDISEEQAIGHLHRLWWWVSRYAQDGTLYRYNIQDLSHAARWDKDASGFVEALVNCGGKVPGFLDQDVEGYRIHDWEKYQSQTAKSRDRQSRYRVKKKQEDPSSDVTVTSLSEQEDPSSDVTVTSLSEQKARDVTVTSHDTTRHDHDDDDRSLVIDLVSSSLLSLRKANVTHTSRKLEDDEVELAVDLANMGFTDSEEVVGKYGYERVATVLDWYDTLDVKIESPGALVRKAIQSGRTPKLPTKRNDVTLRQTLAIVTPKPLNEDSEEGQQAKALWSKACEVMQPKLNRLTFNFYFQPLRIVEMSDGGVTLGASNKDMWTGAKEHTGYIAEVLSEILGQTVSVQCILIQGDGND